MGSIGPQAITRVIKTECKNDTKLDITKDGKPQTCNNITIYPSQFFSPVPYTNFKMSKDVVVMSGSGSIYDVAARKTCPVTYQMATLRAKHF
ncbi:hypothetical protein Pcinc_006279 [Petrolisthes cinctipes]|uniref:Alpha 1,4-glycosyltransferase domain-containing protein n=1 Tax=Petrolisthes cinctipes TaxID=88211 RepID=A0AAE1GHM6_PETCI|nr:hypothetical protein Pcinc_006279 [Petrolisthes cinctipes]